MHASGLGWFHYEGSAAGKIEFRLKIPENQLNDGLRTLHIQDPASQSYATIDAGVDPAQPAPPALDINTLGDLLLSMKGQSIAVYTRLSDVLEGRVVAVEMHLQPTRQEFLAVELEQLRRWIDEDTDAIAKSDKNQLAQLLEQRLKLRSHEEALAELKQRMSGIHEETDRVTKQLSTTLKLSQKPRDLYETKLVELETQRATLVDQYDDLQQQVTEQRKRLSSPAAITKSIDFDPFG